MNHFRFSFQLLLLLPAVLLSNCHERVSKALTSKAVPGTGCLVTLLEPDFKHHYSYTISDGNKALMKHFLGPASVNFADKPIMIKEGFQRYRISWGPGASGAFTRIDFSERKIIEDTNPANESF